MTSFGLLAIVTAILSVAIGIYLIISSRRRRGGEPRCGRCGYNLTGAPSDRCPECGLRFIEAGVHIGSPAATRWLFWIGLALIMLAPLLGGVSATMYMARQAATERAKAQATQKFLQQMLNAPAARPTTPDRRANGD